MQRLLLLVLAAVFLSVLGWMALTKDFGGTPSIEPKGETSVPVADPGGEAPDVALEGVGESEPAQGQRMGAGDPAGQHKDEASRSSGPAVRGVIVVADGGELGRGVRVRARWTVRRGGGMGPSATESPSVGSAGPGESANLGQALEATAQVDRDGSFAVPVPTFARSVRLEVLSDFFGMNRPYRVQGDRGLPVQITVTRGACLLVEFSGPAAGAPDVALSEDFRLIASSIQNGDQLGRTPFPGEDGQLRFGGLPAGAPWRVTLVAKSFLDSIEDVAAIAPMAYGSVRVPVSRGVAAAGRAIDNEGEPVGSVALRLATWSKVDQRLLLGKEVLGTTGDDGFFSVAGALHGEATLHWEAKGFVGGSMKLGGLVEGETRSGLELVLGGGSSITGVVAWPDGEVAAGANVVVTEETRPWREAARVRTDDEGKFEATGLNGTSFLVDVTARRGRRGPRWRATATATDREHLGIVLGPGEKIAGRVTDDAGAAVERFSVSAAPVGRASDAVRVRVTKGDGSYELTGLEKGDWEVSAAAKGYTDEPSLIVSIPRGDRPVDLVLPRLSSLGGLVIDRSGSPVEGARVSIGSRRAVTDGDGAFEIDELPPGEQLIETVAEGYGQPRGLTIHLDAGEEKTDASIVLPRGSRILGSVHPEHRKGTESLAFMRQPRSFTGGGAAIDAEGHFEFSGLEAGTYLVRLVGEGEGDFVDDFARGLEVQVEVAEDSDVEVVLGDPDAYPVTVHGQVTRGGQPAVGMLMYVYRVQEDTHMPRHMGRTDADGRYEAPLRQVGEHSFCVGEGQMRQARFTVDVTGETRQEQNFELPDLVLRGSARLWSGAPARGQALMLTHSDVASADVMVGHTYFAASLADGSFEFSGLHPGTYRLRTGNYMKAHETRGLVIVEGIVVSPDEEPQEIEVLIPEGTVVDVRAEDAGGLPLGGRSVELRNDNGRLSFLRDPRSTDSQGRLRFTGVGLGGWTAVVLGPSGQVVGQARLDVSEGDVVELTVICER